MRFEPSQLLAVLLPTLVLAGASGQTIEVKTGSFNVQHFGTAVAMDGDTDGDGFDDLVVGSPGSAGGVGQIFIYRTQGPDSLATGTVFGFFGIRVAYIGDANGDGHDDLAVGSLGDYVQVLSGFDLSVLHVHTGTGTGTVLPPVVAGAGDTNGDGYDDYLIGEPGFGVGTGRVRLFSGRDHTVLFGLTGTRPTFPGINLGDNLGHSVAGVGDVDRDGFDDFAYGAPGYDFGSAVDCGRVTVLSGRTRSSLTVKVGSAGDFLGRTVAGVGDINRDGRPDVAYSSGDEMAAARGVHVIRGAGGSPLANYLQSGVLGFGETITGSDLDGDGWSDVVVGAPFADISGTSRGAVYVYRGRFAPSPAILRVYQGAAGPDPTPMLFGAALSCGFRNFNQIPIGSVDLAIGSPNWQTAGAPPQRGLVTVQQIGSGSGVPSYAAEVGVGCPTSIGTIVHQEAWNAPRSAATWDLFARGVLPNGFALLVLGAGVNLTDPGAPGCALYANGLSVFVPANGLGVASHSLSIPSGLGGVPVSTAWVVFDPATNGLGIASSAGGRYIVGGL